MTAEAIAKALGGRRAGAAWMARCPAHEDRAPSLSIADARDGKVLVRCHAGCDQQDVIAALRARGVWNADVRQPIRFSRKPDRALPAELDGEATKRTEAALAIWRASQSAQGTPVEIYLRSRGLTIPIPQSIRFHTGLKHRSGAIWPAMVALVTHGVDGKPIGMHRTFLACDESVKAPVDPVKMMLGPCRGGAVRLGPSDDVLMVGEGIETCLAAHAGELPFGMGSAFYFGASRPRPAAHGSRRDRARRWRRSRRSGGAGLRLALEATRPARAHCPPASGHGL
jgi:putative DNA primase/helicase